MTCLQAARELYILEVVRPPVTLCVICSRGSQFIAHVTQRLLPRQLLPIVFALFFVVRTEVTVVVESLH